MECYLNIKMIEIPMQEAVTWFILTCCTKRKKVVTQITLCEFIHMK